jgi:hypothetical protein
LRTLCQAVRLPGIWSLGLVVLLSVDGICQPQEVPVPAAVSDLAAQDAPEDEGGMVELSWELAPDAEGYEVWRGESPDLGFVMLVELPPLQKSYDDTGAVDGRPYWYFVRSVSPGGSADSDVVGPVVARPQWYRFSTTNVLVFLILLVAVQLRFIRKASRGVDLYIRPIAGLEAVDEAVGRSTEMGRPALFVLGIGTLGDVATLAGLTILGRVARKTAQYETRLLVPCTEPVVMTAAQEIVKQAHAEVGRPDTFRESDITYLTYDQFGYAAGVDGIMLREKPGAVFLQGYFAAESLILAETGHSIKAIQIAGTNAVSQLPFFVTACDYTLIGEELFAASTYLSREPLMMGSLKGQDVFKVIILIVIGLGILLGTVGWYSVHSGGSGALYNTFETMVDWFQTG